MTIPYSGDLTPIELAVWAAEFVRVRASHPDALTHTNTIVIASDAANRVVADLRRIVQLRADLGLDATGRR